MRDSQRRGAALVMALLAIIVLDCIVLGTLHLALQEHRIGTNRSAVLQLRLDAESGARLALGLWTDGIDSMTAGTGERVVIPVPGTLRTQVLVERLDDHLYLIESTALEPLPRVGRSAARLLVMPPALPPQSDAAPAPISSSGPVQIAASGEVRVGPGADCTAVPPAFSVRAPDLAVAIDPAATMDAPPGPPTPRPLIESFDRLAALAPRLLAEADSTLSVDAAGVLIVRGSITLTAAAEFRGLLIASGSIIVEPDAAVRGALHATAGVTVAGRVRWDPCVVATAVRASGLDRPVPARPRAWLPAF